MAGSGSGNTHRSKIEKSLSYVVFLIAANSQMEYDSIDIALLTRKEKDWLLGKVQVSNPTKRDLKYRIRKKLEIFQNQELPLFTRSGLFVDRKDYDDIVSSNLNIDSSVVANIDTVVANHDTPGHWGRWSSMVKIPPQRWQNLQETVHESQNLERLQAHTQLNGPGRNHYRTVVILGFYLLNV